MERIVWWKFNCHVKNMWVWGCQSWPRYDVAWYYFTGYDSSENSTPGVQITCVVSFFTLKKCIKCNKFRAVVKRNTRKWQKCWLRLCSVFPCSIVNWTWLSELPNRFVNCIAIVQASWRHEWGWNWNVCKVWRDGGNENKDASI